MNLNKNIKAFFIDLDGTTLDIKKDLKHWASDRNIDAIKKAKKEGKEIIISTGRLGINAEEYIDMIGPSKYTITGNGAVILNSKKKVIKKYSLSVQQTLKILEIVRKYKMTFKTDDNFIAYGKVGFIARRICKKWGFKIAQDYNYPMHKEYIKWILWGKISRLKIKKIVKEIQENVKGVSVVTSSKGYTIEITNEKGTKGKADEYVASLLKIKKSETVHVGDTMNDSTAADHVGRLIVMKNAKKDLKKLSPWRGPHYKNGGLAQVLEGNYKKIG